MVKQVISRKGIEILNLCGINSFEMAPNKLFETTMYNKMNKNIKKMCCRGKKIKTGHKIQWNGPRTMCSLKEQDINLAQNVCAAVYSHMIRTFQVKM